MGLPLGNPLMWVFEYHKLPIVCASIVMYSLLWWLLLCTVGAQWRRAGKLHHRKPCQLRRDSYKGTWGESWGAF